jgi:hypothetical protein
MNIPDYDAYILRGPEEHRSVMMDACDWCAGVGTKADEQGEFDCLGCDGTGEIEVTLDEPDGDDALERRRDAMRDAGYDRRMDE